MSTSRRAAIPAVVVAAIGLALPAWAQDVALPDPTRPPAALSAPAAKAAAVVDGPVLQSVIIAEGHRGAIISGQFVALGGRYGDARLDRVEAAAVVLRGPAGVQTLALFPAVAIRPASTAAAVPANPVAGTHTTGNRSATLERKLPAGAASGTSMANPVRPEGKVAR